MQAADAFVFVTPEYNFNMPPALLNALDFLSKEWNYKPAGFVSYGGVSGGLRSVQMSKHVVAALKMMPMAEGVAIPSFTTHLDEDKNFTPNDLSLGSRCSTNCIAGLKHSNPCVDERDQRHR